MFNSPIFVWWVHSARNWGKQSQISKHQQQTLHLTQENAPIFIMITLFYYHLPERLSWKIWVYWQIPPYFKDNKEVIFSNSDGCEARRCEGSFPKSHRNSSRRKDPSLQMALFPGQHCRYQASWFKLRYQLSDYRACLLGDRSHASITGYMKGRGASWSLNKNNAKEWVAQDIAWR